MLEIKFSPAAQNDLLDAWEYIANNNIAAADVLVERLFAAASKLAVQTLLGRERPELASGIRSLVVSRTRYILFYRITARSIEIVRVLHQSRDIDGQF